MRGLGARRHRTSTVEPRVTIIEQEEPPVGFDVPLPGLSPDHRVAGSNIQGLMQNYYDTYGMWPGFGQRYRGYMSVPAAWRASTMLSDLFASTPWHTYRTTPDGNAIRTPKNAPILESPAGTKTNAARVFGSWGLDYLWEGNAVGIYTAWDAFGRPTAMLPVPAAVVYNRKVTDTDPVDFMPGTIMYEIGGRIFGQSEIFHVKGPCEPGALRGMGILEMELSSPAGTGALRLATELARQAGSIAQAGVPTGQLTTENPEATRAQLTRAKSSWMTAQRTRTVAALGPNIKFEPVAWNPEDMQLVEARKMSLSEAELVFGLPVGWLGGMPAKAYSNIEQDGVNLLKFSPLNGMYTQFEAEFTLIIPRGQAAKATRDAILRNDTLNRYKAHQLATGGRPWMTPDEVRGIEDKAPLGGDAALLNPTPAPIAPEPSTEDGDEES